jgi:benzodiazapine receptor
MTSVFAKATPRRYASVKCKMVGPLREGLYRLEKSPIILFIYVHFQVLYNGIMRLNTAIKLIICLGVTFTAPLIGSFFTRQAVSDWYANLNKPFFTPPNWLFGPVWTALYLLMALAAFLVWQKGLANPLVKISLALYLLQLILNCLWTPLFFGLKMPLAAFCEIVMLWCVIVLTILAFVRVSIPATLLMLAYIVWTSFAALLNFSIWMLNR